MRSFDAAVLVAEMLDQLYSPRLLGQIDMTLDRAISTLPHISPAPARGRDFDSALVGVTQHLHLHALSPPRRLPPHEAFADAMSLLAGAYTSHSGRGYDAAHADVLAEGEDALEAVMNCVAEAFRERRKSDAVDWVIRSAILPLDWHQRCAVAGTLLDLEKDYLPSGILRMQPERLANHIDKLIHLHLRSQPR